MSSSVVCCPIKHLARTSGSCRNSYQNRRARPKKTTQMKIELLEIEGLKPYKLNSKKHPESQIDGIAESIRRFGFTQPIVVDKDLNIIIGHGRIEAAKKAGISKVPCLTMADLSETEVKALRLIDNRIAETSWDPELLGLDLQDLQFDFDPFNIDFKNLKIDPILIPGGADENEVPPLPTEAKSKPGDLYVLGKHRLLCGDSTNPQHVERLLAGVEPSLMVTDPPYGVEYDPDWRNRAERSNGKAIGGRAVGKVSNDDRVDWQAAWDLCKCEVLYVWHAGKYASKVQASLEASGFEIRSQIIWAKPRFVISRGDYHWQHEPCWYAVKKGKGGHWQGDRSQTTLWEIAHNKSDTGHGTQKPVECMRRPILNNSSPGQAIYDPFLGSGTTLIAAEETGRACLGMEIDPRYCDVIVSRWEKFTGKQAVLEDGPLRESDQKLLPGSAKAAS